ncbi:MAG: hypothetical protein EOO88_01065 [Pedobacter sp.]|nr:MAG: hypothetical protein EOO88_01065 [Pedobacter sp.]
MKVLSVKRNGGDSDCIMGVFENEEMAELYAASYLFREQLYHIDDANYLQNLAQLPDGNFAYRAIIVRIGLVIIEKILDPGDFHGTVIEHLANGHLQVTTAAASAEELRDKCNKLWTAEH